MKKTMTTLALLLLAAPAFAGKFADTYVGTSSAAYFVGYPAAGGSTVPAKGLNDRVFTSSGAAVIHSTSSTSGHKVFRILNASGTEVFSATQGGTLTGTVSAATALAANGANCSAGNYPLGVDASGAAEGCTAAGIGDAVLTSTQTWSGGNTLYGSTTFYGQATFNGGVKASSGATVAFAAGANFSSAQTSFNPTASVTGSTITFTTVGSTVTCAVTGHIQINNSGLAILNIMVDGAPVPGTSASAGLAVCGGAAIYCPTGIAYEFQVTPGQHSYYLALAASGGGTAYFLPSATGAGSFTCREVLSK